MNTFNKHKISEYRKISYVFLFLFCLLFSILQAKSATKLSIKGKVLDAENNQAVISAKVSLLNSIDSNLITGTLSKSDGSFEFDELENANYFIKINALGYKEYISDNIILITNNVIDLGRIGLQSGSIMTSEAIVTAEKQLIEITSEGKLINVENNAMVSGGSLLDVLQITPSVTVDFDGNVTMRGSNSINILIDGQTIPSSSDLRISLLESIPASSVESIELINNPNAKYNPKGVGGVINIKLKKKRQNGLNGIISSNIGTKDKYNLSGNFNWGFKDFNLFISNDTRIDTRQKNGTLDIENNYSNFTVNSSQNNTGFRRLLNNNTRFGFDLYLSDNTNFNFYTNYSTRTTNSPENINNEEVWFFNNNYDTTSAQFTNIKANSVDQNLLVSMSFSHKFKDREKLKIDFNFTNKNSDDFLNRNSIELLRDSPFNFNSNINDLLHNFNFEGIYTKPLKFQSDIQNLLLDSNLIKNSETKEVKILDKLLKNKVVSKLEMGWFANVRDANSIYQPEIFDFENNIWTIDNDLNNNYVLDRQIYSIFANYDNKINDWLFEIGLRAETANIKLTQFQNNQTNVIKYNSLFPNLGLKYSISETDIINFNYSRRIDRPSVNNLNPFIEIDNPLLIKYGNPNVKPEYINSFELGYSILANKRTIFASLFYRNIENAIRKYNFVDSNGITNSTYDNFDGSEFIGLELINDEEITKWWKLNSTISIYYNKIGGKSDLGIIGNDNVVWNAKINSTMKLFWGIDMQSFVYYESPLATPQGQIQSFFNIDFALKKEIIDNLTVSLRFTDILNTYNYNRFANGTADDLSFNQFTFKKKETQVAFINLSYKINNGVKVKEKIELEENFESEKDNKGD